MFYSDKTCSVGQPLSILSFLNRSDLIALFGYTAAGAVFATFCMRTMRPLRSVALLSNILFISYGALGRLYPVLILHACLLPMNAWRLLQVLRLQRASISDNATFDVAILRPYTMRRDLPAGATLFHRGDPAKEVFWVDTGELVLPDLGVALGPGSIVGELGVLSRHGQHTATVAARTDCSLLALSATRMQSLYFQHPGFALHLLNMLADRLIEHLPPPCQSGSGTPEPGSLAPPVALTAQAPNSCGSL